MIPAGQQRPKLPPVFRSHWWDQAVTIANRRSTLSGRRHRVQRNDQLLWEVVPA